MRMLEGDFPKNQLRARKPGCMSFCSTCTYNSTYQVGVSYAIVYLGLDRRKGVLVILCLRAVPLVEFQRKFQRQLWSVYHQFYTEFTHTRRMKITHSMYFQNFIPCTLQLRGYERWQTKKNTSTKKGEA